MTDQAQPRRLTAIVALDMAGFSARMEKDEAVSATEVVGLRNKVTEITRAHSGRVFSTAGDGFMLEFGSGLTAVKAAIDLAEKCEPKVRVGVHLGDVHVQPNGDLLGHGVNVAARLMARTAPGSAMISAAVRETLHDPIADRLIPRGMLKLEKMNETLEVFMFTAADTEPLQQAHSQVQRKLTAILIADMIGYTDLMETDETATHEWLMANRTTIFEPQVTIHGGRVVKYVADTALAEFSSAVAALNCALAIQQATEAAVADPAQAGPVRYRMGINLGEVILEGTDIYGEGVIVAARLQTFAPDGGVAVSRIVRDQVQGKAPCTFEDVGEHPVNKAGRRSVQVFLARPQVDRS